MTLKPRLRGIAVLLAGLVALVFGGVAWLAQTQPDGMRAPSSVPGTAADAPPTASEPGTEGTQEGPGAARETPEPTELARLGLHVTNHELAVWRERAQQGPYRSVGDVSENSPGDWDRIVANRQAFVANPQSVRWQGPAANNPGGCVQNGLGDSEHGDHDYLPPIGPPEELRDAAFHTLVAEPANGQEVAGLIRTELLWQTIEPGIDFRDRTRFCTEDFGTGYNPVFSISNWLVKLLFAYDYITIYQPDLFTEDERGQIDAWFDSAAAWIVPQINLRQLDMFTIGARGDYEVTETALQSSGRPIWSGGPTIKLIQNRYNNHIPKMARFVTLVGIMQDNNEYMDVGRDHVRESLMFAYYPQGAMSDFHRWTRKDPILGWKYSMEYTGALITIADHLARGGDDGLYLFDTSLGTPDTAGSTPDEGVTSGEAKSLQTLVRQMIRYVDATSEPARYGCRDCSDVKRKIDSEDEVSGEGYANDLQVIMANLYYQDPYVTSIYTRQHPGTPAYPANPSVGQGRVEGGESGVYPGVLFMFGQTEELVDPYPDPGSLE